MTETQAPYDAGLHPPGFCHLARVGTNIVATHNGTVYVLRDSGDQIPLRSLESKELDVLVADLARLVGGMRDALVEIYQAEDELPDGPLTLALGAGGMEKRRKQ
jgi:hypothetical protein